MLISPRGPRESPERVHRTWSPGGTCYASRVLHLLKPLVTTTTENLRRKQEKAFAGLWGLHISKGPPAKATCTQKISHQSTCVASKLNVGHVARSRTFSLSLYGGWCLARQGLLFKMPNNKSKGLSVWHKCFTGSGAKGAAVSFSPDILVSNVFMRIGRLSKDRSRFWGHGSAGAHYPGTHVLGFFFSRLYQSLEFSFSANPAMQSVEAMAKGFGIGVTSFSCRCRFRALKFGGSSVLKCKVALNFQSILYTHSKENNVHVHLQDSGLGLGQTAAGTPVMRVAWIICISVFPAKAQWLLGCVTLSQKVGR